MAVSLTKASFFVPGLFTSPRYHWEHFEAMTSCYAKGVKRVLVYYCGGIILSIVFQMVVGWRNTVVMPKSMLVLIVVMVAALPWASLNIMGMVCPVKGAQNRGELVVHCAVFAVGFLVFLTRSIFL